MGKFNVIASETGLKPVITQACLQALDLGSDSWWQALSSRGVPRVELISNECCHVTFFWRDAEGNEATSNTCRVYIDVNSVTNHHAFMPESLKRVAGTDVWYWQVELPSNWRGSYTFIPVNDSQLAPVVQGEPELHREQHRQWWRSIMLLAQKDGLNPQMPYVSASTEQFSALHLPHAPDQSAWQQVDRGAALAFEAECLRSLSWNSALLANQRKVWVYSCGSAPSLIEQQARPLVLLLDGQHWVERMPVFSALDRLTQQGALPAAVYVLIDVIDGQHRQEELACNPLFWQAIQTELLPSVVPLAPHSTLPERSVVAGQSLGGLAALYAGLHFPQRFGCVLSQSGSFWWPYMHLLDASPGQACPRKPGSRGLLAEQLQAGALSAESQLKVYLEVGLREDVMIDLNDSIHTGLQQAGHHVNYVQFEGGHDWLCWRGGLLDGLSWLLS